MIFSSHVSLPDGIWNVPWKASHHPIREFSHADHADHDSSVSELKTEVSLLSSSWLCTCSFTLGSVVAHCLRCGHMMELWIVRPHWPNTTEKKRDNPWFMGHIIHTIVKCHLIDIPYFKILDILWLETRAEMKPHRLVQHGGRINTIASLPSKL